MFRWLIRCFLAGFFTILPLVITVAIVLWLGDYINRLFGPGTIIGGWLRSLGSFGSHFATNKTLAYIIGWVIVLGAHGPCCRRVSHGLVGGRGGGARG